MAEKEDHIEYNNNLFKRMLPVYDWVALFLCRIRKDILKILPQTKLKIIDIACGTGTQAINLAKNGHQVVGIDISPNMLFCARSKIKKPNNPIFKTGNATEIDYPNYSDNFFCSTRHAL